MTDDTQHPDDTEDRSDDHQRVVEACEHTIDALHDSNLPHAHSLVAEAQAALERAQHDDSEQAQRETAYDCYD